MNKVNNIELLDDCGVLIINDVRFYFDLEDLPIVKCHYWYKDKDGYMTRSYYYNGKLRYVRFHRVIMNAKTDQYIDHINKNRADNRKSNLRICTREENDRNRGLYKNNKSGITGVYFDIRRSKWIASITYNNQRLFLGRFDVELDAIKTRLKKEQELFKEFAPQKHLLEVYS